MEYFEHFERDGVPHHKAVILSSGSHKFPGFRGSNAENVVDVAGKVGVMFPRPTRIAYSLGFPRWDQVAGNRIRWFGEKPLAKIAVTGNGVDMRVADGNGGGGTVVATEESGSCGGKGKCRGDMAVKAAFRFCLQEC